MNNNDYQELKNIDLWVHIGAITYDEAKRKAQPFIDNMNEKSKAIAKKLNVKPRLFSFNDFIH
jgi:polyhydroxyalkanoate synthesis regulator phasin